MKKTSKRTLNLEMGNLICRFGQDLVLLDLAEEVVLPAFLSKGQVRTYGSTRFLFHDVQPVLLTPDEGQSTIGIVGRFIKDTNLTREQIFHETKGLIQDSGSLRSSPSAIFLLILENHRLIYVKETKHAPDQESFKATLLSFLRSSHEKFINKLHQERKALRENDTQVKAVTKKDLRTLYPRPTLELIPLTSDESIEKFVQKYKILKSLEIALGQRNDETDNDPFFDQVQKRKDAIGSARSILVHSNSKGLEKDVAVQEIAEATAQGNQEVKLVGEDQHGDILRGNNEKFQLRKPIDDLDKPLPEAANDLYATFTELVKEGTVKVPEITRKARQITTRLARSLFP